MGADQAHDWRLLAASALEWWRDAGVDTLVDDAPRDWLAKARATPAPAETVVPGVALPRSLAEFEAWRAGADAPETAAKARKFVAEGDAASGMMVLVDCPDADGIVTGAAGQLFDRMLAAIGRDRASIYLAPLAIARPVAGRITPEMEAALTPLLRHHVRLAAPKRLLVLGVAASRALLGPDRATSRGSLLTVNLDGFTVDAVAGFSPSGLLKQPAAKAESWRGLQLLTGGLR
jgi:DNA polymerase